MSSMLPCSSAEYERTANCPVESSCSFRLSLANIALDLSSMRLPSYYSKRTRQRTAIHRCTITGACAIVRQRRIFLCISSLGESLFLSLHFLNIKRQMKKPPYFDGLVNSRPFFVQTPTRETESLELCACLIH